VKQKLHPQAKQNKELTRYFPSAGRCSAISTKAGSIMCNGYLGKQTPSLRKSAPSFFCQLYMLHMVLYGIGYPFGELGSAVLALSPPSFLCTSSLLAGGVR